ncbi:MAG: polysaccharide deacetylase family protein [Archangium sp.]|nr:polysaccharide deacetylase family protein [Archangium sp.]MDP3156508.1 polysaccharide deacetylase family protein [Archangium sp.]MDP3571699.1 polysaccharide deacetylase family protein [Archangium sp.]
MRLSALSVDLDSLPHYCRIQGLPETLLDEQARGLVASKAIPRLLELFARHHSPATFFVIGADVGLPGMREALRASHAAGVELASHSFSHDYAISRRPLAEIEADLVQCEAALETVGVKPKGFRAPGYTLSPALLQAVAARGYEYDSSAFPAVPYYLAKGSVMGVLQALGRPSRAILDSPRVLLAPRTPYRPSLQAPYSRGDSALVELPMAVAPFTRLPFIGTFATSAPWVVVEAAFRSLRRDVLFNFEMHALDVLDHTDGIPKELVRQQRDLQVPARVKLERLGKLFAWLGADRDRVTVLDAARRLSSKL